MGQNITTALKQIACDELGINPDQLQVKLHATDSIERVRATVGSESIMDFHCHCRLRHLASGHEERARLPAS